VRTGPDLPASVPIAEAFFTRLLPKLDDARELKLALHALRLLASRESVSASDLLADEAVRQSLPGLDSDDAERLLRQACAHGVLRPMDGEAAEFKAGEGLEVRAGQINIFELYEQNIGLLSPLIAEELKEAEQRYPGEWIEGAFREAVARNVRNWRYIARILERWESQGRADGEPKRYHRPIDPAKYKRGRYGHLVR